MVNSEPVGQAIQSPLLWSLQARIPAKAKGQEELLDFAQPLRLQGIKFGAVLQIQGCNDTECHILRLEHRYLALNHPVVDRVGARIVGCLGAIIGRRQIFYENLCFGCVSGFQHLHNPEAGAERQKGENKNDQLAPAHAAHNVEQIDCWCELVHGGARDSSGAA